MERAPTPGAAEGRPADRPAGAEPNAPGPAGAAPAGAAAPSFELSAQRLGAIVSQLESGELSLEQSLRLFEEGVRVAREAQRRLDQAERRVEELLGVDDRGEPIVERIS